MQIVTSGASQVVLVVKNLPANSGDTEDVGSVTGSGRFPGGGHGLQWMRGIHSGILAWRIPWTEKPGRLQPIGSQKQLNTCKCTVISRETTKKNSWMPIEVYKAQKLKLFQKKEEKEK